MVNEFLGNRLFPKRTEYFNLFFPILLLGFTIMELLLVFAPGNMDRFLVIFLVKIVFLNSSHVVLSLLILFYLPEGRAFLRKSNGYEAKLLGLASVCLVSFFSYFVFLPASPIVPKKYLLLIYSFLLEYWSVAHFIFQTRGIALMYEGLGGPKSYAGAASQNSLSLIYEKSLYGLLVLVRCTAFLVFVPRILEIPTPSLLSYIAPGTVTTLLGVSIVLLIVFNHCKKGIPFANGPIFLARLFHSALAPISFVSTFSLQAVHGVESLFFTNYIFDKSEREKKAVPSIYIIAGTLLLVTLLVFPIFVSRILGHTTAIEYDGFGRSSHWWINVLIVGIFSLTAIHFYLDTRIYKMRKLSVRETIGKLLLTK